MSQRWEMWGAGGSGGCTSRRDSILFGPQQRLLVWAKEPALAGLLSWTDSGDVLGNKVGKSV